MAKTELAEGTEPIEADQTTEPAESAEPAEGIEENGEQRRGPRLPRFDRRIAGWAPVLALTALAAVGCWQWRAHAAAEDRRQEVDSAAAEFGRLFLTYDHRDVTASRKAVSRLITGDFADSYRTQFDSGVAPTITRLEAASTAEVRAVYLGEINGDLASAVVVVDSEMRSKVGTKWTTASHLSLKLIEKDGAWLVSDLASAGALEEKMVDPEGNPVSAGRRDTADDAPR
ncbi:hypothetical protein [Actinocorallia populi]|uniref:hypothetical protein n=1 Tax=Actinocorallia populi TaxID=2079200 RepID=UPI0013006922|nr:hypothetical protein [Actinocorallia populi]